MRDGCEVSENFEGNQGDNLGENLGDNPEETVRKEKSEEKERNEGKDDEGIEAKCLSICSGDEQLLQKFDKEVTKILQIVTFLR